MALHWPTFFTRLGSAIVFSAIMMAGLLWNEWAFLVLILITQFFCLKDYFRLMAGIFPASHPHPLTATTIQVTGILLTGYVLLHIMGRDTGFFPLVMILPVLSLLLAVLSRQLTLSSVLQSWGGLLYITLPVILLLLLRFQNMLIPLALVLMIWMNDTMAYLTGSVAGKTSFSAISPKKTWEGTVGGVLFTLVGAAVWGYFAPCYRMVDWMVLAVCASVAGTAGDLFESQLKRMAGVKDSGKLLPGHGGALDRFDSLLVATPFAYAYAAVFMPDIPWVIF